MFLFECLVILPVDGGVYSGVCEMVCSFPDAELGSANRTAVPNPSRTGIFVCRVCTGGTTSVFTECSEGGQQPPRGRIIAGVASDGDVSLRFHFAHLSFGGDGERASVPLWEAT